MNESEARVELKQLGITPTPVLIRNWIRAVDVEHRFGPEESDLAVGMMQAPLMVAIEPITTHASKPRADGLPLGSSKSNLEPALVEQGTLEKSASGRKPGRPRIIASWFPAVAKTMADGTSLRTALAVNRLYLNKAEMRALYRNVTFKAMYQEARRRFLIEHFGRRPKLRAGLVRIL